MVNDALAGVGFLKQRSEIEPSQIGMWGLSQGAYISAAAASRSADIQFVVVVGSDVADGMLFYYRDNLFRKYGLSDTLRDVAEKAQLGADTLFFYLRDEALFSTFAQRTYPPPEENVHPAWSRVHRSPGSGLGLQNRWTVFESLRSCCCKSNTHFRHKCRAMTNRISYFLDYKIGHRTADGIELIGNGFRRAYEQPLIAREILTK